MDKIVDELLRPLGHCFMAGLLAILPIVLTIAIVIWVVGFIQGIAGPETTPGRWLESLGLQFASNRIVAYLLGWFFVLSTIFALGFFVQIGAKRFLQQMSDAVFRRIPVIGSVYGTSKQLAEMFDRNDESDLKAMSVVFCTFGASGGTGVLALMPSRERFCIDGTDYHVVIIPTAPVPFGGGLVFMPVNSVKPANLSVDALMSIYVSMGVTAPQFMGTD